MISSDTLKRAADAWLKGQTKKEGRMTDEELQAIRGIMKNLRNGSADLVGTVESANLIETLLNEIDRLKKEYYGWDAETKAGFWRQADSIRKYQQETDQLKVEIEHLKDTVSGLRIQLEDEKENQNQRHGE